jgi:RNA polymerase sigma factor (sigma-70 family)
VIVVDRPLAEACTDAELLEQVRSGDLQAFGALYSRYFGAAYRLARARRARDPEDLAGEAFMKILNAVSRGCGPSKSFWSYLATTVRNLVADEAKQREIPVAEIEECAPHLARAPGPLELLVDSEERAAARAALAAALAALPPAERELLLRVDVDRRGHAELAAELGISSNAVAARAYRARKRLHAEYGADRPAV